MCQIRAPVLPHEVTHSSAVSVALLSGAGLVRGGHSTPLLTALGGRAVLGGDTSQQ